MNEEVNYLKEHLYEIYQYKKSMKDLTYDMDLEHLLRTCKTLDYLQKKYNKQKKVLDKIKKMFEHSNLIKYYHGMSYEFEINDFKDDILELMEEIE